MNLYHNLCIPIEVSHKERCRGPMTFWCIFTIYAHLVLFISTSMTVGLQYLKYATPPVCRCYSSPLPLLIIGLLTMAVLARFCPPGRNRAAEILSARAAEIPFSPSFSPMGRNCLKLFTYTALLYALAVDGDFLHFAISYISWLIHQLAYAQSMCRVSSVWLHH